MTQENMEDTAGSSPAERSGAGDDPADAASAAGESDSTPVRIPAGPRPFGAGPVPGGPRPRRKRLVAPEDAAKATRSLTPEQRLLILDTWQRSGLPARDFSTLVGVSHHTLYAWKRRFEELGPAGLTDGATKRGATGSKLPEATKRAIVMLKRANPEWGCQRISDVLYRGPGLPASAKAVGRVLKDSGYVTEERETRPHPDRVRRFERARPNQLWQTDLFTFVLKRQNRRMYLVAFMDDHSRFIVGYGLHASQSAALVLEVFRSAIASCEAPEEVLTDNGAQYITWRGTSQFAKECRKRGIAHVVASPRRPQTLGKIERFWGTMWRECIESAIFIDLADARTRLGLFIDYYNFRRPHQGIDGIAPADRFFGASSQVLQTLKARVDANALELARSGVPRDPFYVTGQVGGKPFSVHAEGERVVMVGEDGERREVDLVSPASPEERPTLPKPVSAQGIVSSDLVDEHEPPRSDPAHSPLDAGLEQLASSSSPAGVTPEAPGPENEPGEGGAS